MSARIRRASLALAGCAALGTVPPAGALMRAGPTPTNLGGPVVSASLQECHVAVDQADRYAIFTGRLQTIPGSERMAVRIDLRERELPGGRFHLVQAPDLGVWHRSEPGVHVYAYVNRVINLTAPAAFRAVVRFRWYDAGGHLLRSAQRLTAVCVQPDERPLLAVGAVSAIASPGSSNAQYQIEVRNQGRGPADAFDVVLTVNGRPQPALTVPSLSPAERTVLTVVAPRCFSGSQLLVALDPGRQLSEAPGGGAPQTTVCPLAARA